MYGPPPGRVWVAGDYSQLEARILAILACDHVSLGGFGSGGDVHTEKAVDLLGRGAVYRTDGPPDGASRNFAKGFLYGISYGGKAETLKTKLYCPCPRCADKVPPTLDLTRADLSAASQRWFAKHAPVLRFREALSDQVRDSACYTNPLGRKRYVATPWPRCLTQVYNIPMQSTAADLINRALRRCEAEGLEVVLQMHDELVVECDPEDVPHVARRLRAAMEEPVPEMDGAVFPVDLKVGDRWDRLAKYTP
jgi:DNA polymerase-1